MAIINELLLTTRCSCGELGERVIQFRYGHLRLHRYSIGSRIHWDEPSVGSPSEEFAIVDGWLVACPGCGFDGEIWVLIAGGRIVGPTQVDPSRWSAADWSVYRYED